MRWRLVLYLMLLASGYASAEDEEIERKLNETMALQTVTYTSVNVSYEKYNASTYFNPKGMGQLYNVTNIFIDFIQAKQAYPEGMMKVVNGSIILADPLEEWYIILTHYGGLAGLGAVGLILAAILPCVGLFFCCCRCAGHCGARSQPFDKKHDHCRKIMLSFILIGFATILLFGVVCAFVTNEHMHDGTKDLPKAAKVSLLDVKLYLKQTKGQIDTLLNRNYVELEKTLNGILHRSGKIVTDQLAESSHAVSLMNLNDIVNGLENIKQDLKMMADITRELRNNATQLDAHVRKVKNQLLQTLKNCNTHECREATDKYRINELVMKVEFDKLPDMDVMNVFNNISHLLDDNIVDEVSKGKEQFMNIQKEIQQAVNQTIPVVSASIRSAGGSLAEVANTLFQIFDRLNRDIDRIYIPQLDVAKGKIDKFSPYRYYLGLSISGVLLTVLTCLTFGLLCGICGKRPDGYGDDCCNKGSGARFLMMAVWIIFLLTSILMVVTVVHMLTGVLAERAICEPLKNPNDNRMFEFVDELVQIRKMIYPKYPNADINMSHILNSCHRNESIYKVLKLEYVINVDTLRNYIKEYDINETIHQLEEKISLSRNYRIISQAARQKLNALAQSGLSDMKFYQFTDNLQDNITSINLEQLAGKLRELAGKLRNEHDKVKVDLLAIAYDLEGYHRSIVIPMTNLSSQLNNTAIELQEHIRFNHSSMAEAIHSLVNEVDKAQVFITDNGPAHVKTLASEFGKTFIYQVNSYLNYMIGNILENIGKCGPVSNAYNATLVAGCNRILDPFNGFWMSVGWCLILFIPTIILCVKLSALYQKSDPYPGPLVEAEYLYDAYADRDNVPLAQKNVRKLKMDKELTRRGGKKENDTSGAGITSGSSGQSVHDKKYAAHSRHHHHHPGSGYVESYDGPAHGYDRERIVDAHQSSSHHESRYSDLAPKNWDFPNGGPPRYQPAAVAPPLTEYERPPPYYYPGPGERN